MQKIFKFLWSKKWYILIIIIFLSVIVALSIKISQMSNRNNSLVVQLADAQKIVKETESIYSQYAILSEDAAYFLNEENKELLKLIKEKDEHPVIVIQEKIIYKKVYINSEDPNTSVTVTTDPATGSDEKACDKNFKVEFKFNKPYIAGNGHTNTKPPSFDLEIQVKPLEVDVTVAKNQEGKPVTYIDTHNKDITITAMNTVIDSSLFPKNKNNIINVLMNYNTKYIGLDEWEGAEIGVQYIRMFNFPLTVGAQVEAGFDGSVTLGATLGGKF